MISQGNGFFWVYGHLYASRQWLAASQHTNAPQNARFESNLGLVKACLLRADEVTKRGHETALQMQI